MCKKLVIWASALCLIPSVVFAAEEAAEAVPPEELGDLISQLIAAAQGGQWSVFVALLIMVLVFLATKIEFIDNLIPNNAKPWVATVAGVLAAIASAAFTSGNWLQAILGGLVTGAAASGLWELIGKKVFKKKAEEK